MKKTISLVLVLALGLATGGLAQAATITVGSGVSYDFDTIQGGIDVAVDGDTVLVASGDYVITVPITFRGKAITVRSEAGTDETTIRMGTPVDSKRGSVVIFENNETAASILDGFTITGGRGFWWPSASNWGGGGISFDASSGTVKNCAIIQNRAKNGGGVMVYSGASTTLTNCIIRGNSATGVTMWVDGFGGGLFCMDSSLLTLTNCTITGNSAGVSSGGVFCGSTSSVIMTHCAITSNTSQRYSGAMECAHGSAILTNCLIARNTAPSDGGGVTCTWKDGSMSISNCTIWGNSGGQTGGGVACWKGSSATVTNSIVWGNTAARGREIYLEQAPTEFSVTYSNVAGGQAGVKVEGGTLDWGAGNIDADPCFTNPNNDDFHLKSEAGRWDPNSQSWVQYDVTSPCIDAGDPMSPIGLEPFPNGGFVNMGAYCGTPEASKSYFGEPVCGTIVAGDINGDCQVDQADLEIMALHWTDDEPLPLP